MNPYAILEMVYAHPHVKYLTALLVANLLLGVVASFLSGDFKFSKVGDWLVKRLLPLFAGYGAAALIAEVNPDLTQLRDVAFYTLTATMLGFIAANLKEFGVPIPEKLAGK